MRAINENFKSNLNSILHDLLWATPVLAGFDLS